MVREGDRVSDEEQLRDGEKLCRKDIHLILEQIKLAENRNNYNPNSLIGSFQKDHHVDMISPSTAPRGDFSISARRALEEFPVVWDVEYCGCDLFIY